MSAERVGRFDELAHEWGWTLDSLGRRRRTWIYHWYTPLFTCELCGRFGAPMRVRPRDDLFDAEVAHWTDYKRGNSPTLCTGCWNRLRPLYRRLADLGELRQLAKRLERLTRKPAHERTTND